MRLFVFDAAPFISDGSLMTTCMRPLHISVSCAMEKAFKKHLRERLRLCASTSQRSPPLTDVFFRPDFMIHCTVYSASTR